MKKQKEFMNVQHAQDYKEKLEKTQKFLKIPMLISIPLSIFLTVVLWNPDMIPDGTLGEIVGVLGTLSLIATSIIWIIAIIKGGKMLLSCLAKILFFGFIFFPFPINLFVGVLGAVLVLYAILFAPWVVLLAVMLSSRKEIKRAEEYIYYNSVTEMNHPVSE